MNAFTGAAPGQGGQAFASAMGAFAGIFALSLPLAIPIALGLGWLCAVAPVYGLLVETLGRRLGATIGFARMPELVAAVSKPT